MAHTILVIAFRVLRRKQDHYELGGHYFDRLSADGLRRSLVRRLERLGHKVTLESFPQAAQVFSYEGERVYSQPPRDSKMNTSVEETGETIP